MTGTFPAGGHHPVFQDRRHGSRGQAARRENRASHLSGCGGHKRFWRDTRGTEDGAHQTDRPAGAKVMARLIEQKWHASSPPTREEFLRLVDLLKDEIENPDDRNEFLKEAARIIL